jgi:hypothetical protein
MLSLTGALIGDDGLLIDCVISNACSMPASSVATLTVTNGVGGGGGGGLLTDNLISFYRMDESSAGTRADAFGANDLTDVGVNVASAAGVINNSAAFDGGNKTLSHADNASLSMTSQSFTLQVFVKLGSVADNQHVVGKWGATGEYTIYITGDRFVFFRQDATGGGNGLVTATSFGAISTGVSYQVLAGQDTATGKLFIQVKTAGNEGTARDTTDYSDDGMDGAAAFTVGQFDGGGAILTGNVDLVGIWKRVITTTEATELFNGGAGRDPVTNP